MVQMHCKTTATLQTSITSQKAVQSACVRQRSLDVLAKQVLPSIFLTLTAPKWSIVLDGKMSKFYHEIIYIQRNSNVKIFFSVCLYGIHHFCKTTFQFFIQIHPTKAAEEPFYEAK